MPIPLAVLARLALLFVALLGASVARADPDPPLNVDLRAGPVVWKEEYWDVRPEKYEQFLTVYAREIYPVIRKAKGYRGQVVMSFAPKNGDRLPTGHPDRLAATKLIGPHWGLYTGSRLTERSLNFGTLMARTHSVVIAHSFATWEDAERHDRGFAAAYRKLHGADAAERIAATLFPLAENYWESYFRLVTTGYPMLSGKGSDADGLDLTPRPGGFMVKEYWDIDPAKLDVFIATNDRLSYSVVRKTGGNRGMTVLTTIPPSAGQSPLSTYARQHYPLGGPDTLYVPKGGARMGGVRTDQSLNLSLPFKPTFNVIAYYHQTTNAESLMLDLIAGIYAKDHPGGDWLTVMKKEFFPFGRNHWDMTYYVESDSFTPERARQ